MREAESSDTTRTCREPVSGGGDEPERAGRIRNRILVLSGKGGVGKSTVAAHLAVALARLGRSVGLLDVDLHGPSATQLFGLQGRRLEADANGNILPLRADEHLSVVSIGLLLDNASDAVIWRGPMKYKMIGQFLNEVRWGEIDDLVIDSPPGTGDEPLAVAQQAGAGTAAVVVTTPQDLAIADVRRSLSFCRSLDLEILGIVENMSGFVCPHCGEAVDLFKSGGGQRLAHETGVPFLGHIPIDPRLVEAGDAGCTHDHTIDDSPANRVFQKLCEVVVARAISAGAPGDPGHGPGKAD